MIIAELLLLVELKPTPVFPSATQLTVVITVAAPNENPCEPFAYATQLMASASPLLRLNPTVLPPVLEYAMQSINTDPATDAVNAVTVLLYPSQAMQISTFAPLNAVTVLHPVAMHWIQIMELPGANAELVQFVQVTL